MDTFLIMLRNVILFVVLSIPGYLLVKTGELKPEGSGPLSKLLMYVGLPFLILTSTMNNLDFSSAFLFTSLAVAGMGILIILVTFFISKPLTKGEKDEKKRGMLRFGAVFPNNGFLGIPLAAAVFGADSPVLTVVILLNIITNVMLYTLGIYLVSGDKKSISLKKAFFNPVLISFVCGVVLNLIKIKEYIPEVSTFSGHFSNLVTPVSMTILGMKMGSVNTKDLFVSKKMYFASIWKLVLFPVAVCALLLGAKQIFPESLFTSDLILGFFIAFSMPTAGLASTFADNFQGDTEGAVKYTLGSTLLSILTIPCLYWILCLMMGV